jgi:hypothetical protein
MKQLKNIVSTILGLLAVFYFATACDDMNDIQEKFTEKAEQVYLGKVDSVVAIPGFGRAKLTWYIGSDPKIEKTVIYWNMRADSIIKDFVRTGSGLQRDSTIIENLPEGSMLFEFRNINSKGESSLFSSTTATVWGNNFANTLIARRLTSKDFDYANSSYTLGLSSAANNRDMAYSLVSYTTKSGTEKTIRIEKDVDEVELTDIADGAEFRFRNVFFLPTGMDTVYSSNQIYNVPKAVNETGSKLSLQMSPDSRFFERTGNLLYEWTTGSDLIEYLLNEDGSITKNKTLPAAVPRNSYRELFFSDGDRFISINTAHQVVMFQMTDLDKMEIVKTSAGADFFGSGFNFPQFVPAKAFFFSVAANGETKTWFPNPNATWGSPNGATVSPPALLFKLVILYNDQNIIGVDEDGYMWSIPITSNGGLGVKSKIGQGWNKFVNILAVGKKLIAANDNGDFYAFDFDADDTYWIQ